jgi:hypothetical protein
MLDMSTTNRTALALLDAIENCTNPELLPNNAAGVVIPFATRSEAEDMLSLLRTYLGIDG